MDDLIIRTRQEPGVAEPYNFEEIRDYLDARLDVYRNLIYSEDGPKTAKTDVANLNKLKKAPDARRKETKPVYLEPCLRTEAQITEFITAAQEANAVNVLAALLEYKNTHFADFDPMEEFTLEW